MTDINKSRTRKRSSAALHTLMTYITNRHVADEPQEQLDFLSATPDVLTQLVELKK
jgi:hypothetical protein